MTAAFQEWTDATCQWQCMYQYMFSFSTKLLNHSQNSICTIFTNGNTQETRLRTSN